MRNDMLLDSEQVRPAWLSLWQFINQSSKADLDRLSLSVLDELDEQAITYTIHGDGNVERPWDLDSIPYLLAEDEWRSICTGLDQRARCLDRLLADCYGRQQCVESGLIPPAYIFEHPDFLQSCRSWSPPNDIFLHCYAADLVRDSSGTWKVLADRCQSPLGIGYALQNRFVIANALPELYQKLTVQRQRVFFQRLDQCLRGFSKAEEPRIVILASSAYGDNDYEQAFLARYLGYDLVNGHDLTVRNDHCYVKTVSGLSRVDVLLRFVNDGWCDPMSFRPESTLGVPGLARAAAAGNVVMANALGSGLLDSPIIRPLVGEACRQLLKEEPLLEGLPSIWGPQLDLNLADPSLIFKPTWNALRAAPLMNKSMTAQERADLSAKIAAHPEAWCADRALSASVAPVWQGKVLGYRSISLRVYLVREGDHYRALPGGLLRTAEDPDDLHLGARHGGGSKDCWVLGGGEAPLADPLPVMPSFALRRNSLALPSSRCDDLFWFGRHLEACEELARLLRISQGLQRELLQGDIPDVPKALFDLLNAALFDTSQLRLQTNGQRRAQILATLLKKSLQNGGIFSVLINQLLQVAGRVHYLLSQDTWLHVQRLRELLDGNARFDPFEHIVLLCSAVSGSINENTVHNDSWRFLELGRRLRRSIGISGLLSAIVGREGSAENLPLALKICDSTLTYRSRYRAAYKLEAVIDLIVHDAANPRSLQFQVDLIQELLEQLPRPGLQQDVASTAFEALRQELIIAQTVQPGETLQMCFNKIIKLVYSLSDAIDHVWFSHALPTIAVGRNQKEMEYVR